ncbi:MAG: DUF2231 domain-containing protein [Terricaulis sp.]
MKQNITWLRRASVLAAFLAVVVVTPVSAQQVEDHPTAAQQEQATLPPAGEAIAPDGEVVMTMPWPTEVSSGGMMMDHDARPTTFQGRLIRWLGGWHPAIIHFPIALLLTVAFLEFMALVRRKPLYTASNKLLLAIGTLGAFAAAPLGWLNAGLPAADDESALTIHRWLGSAFPFLMLLLWWLKPKAEEAVKRLPRPVYEIVLAIAVIAVLVQSYFGAEVTHGAGHMAF